MCNDCKHLKAVGCGDKFAAYCEIFKQEITRPEITGCNKEEQEEHDNTRAY